MEIMYLLGVATSPTSYLFFATFDFIGRFGLGRLLEKPYLRPYFLVFLLEIERKILLGCYGNRSLFFFLPLTPKTGLSFPRSFIQRDCKPPWLSIYLFFGWVWRLCFLCLWSCLVFLPVSLGAHAVLEFEWQLLMLIALGQKEFPFVNWIL